MFYKVKKDGEIVDALDNIVYVKIQIVHDRLIICSEKYAEGILSSDGTSIWFVADLIEENVNGYDEVELVEIEEDEYDILRAALESNQTVEDTTEEEETDDDEDDVDETTLEFVRESKISEMSTTCNALIVDGFDIELSDGETHHFDFAVDDQLNMMSLKELIEAGETAIPYHASDEACKFYSVDDIELIINAGTSLKTYHITYFNALKEYIKSLDNITDIAAVYYGMEIPEEYQSEVLAALLGTTSTTSATEEA